MKKLNEFLKNKKVSLGYLQKRAQLLESLTHHVQACLPNEFAAHCRVSRYDDQLSEIVITIEQQNLLTPLRFLKPRLQKQLRAIALFANLKEVQFVFAPTMHTSSTKREPFRSSAAAEACLTAAEFCKLPELRQSLTKLAQQLNHNHQDNHEKN